MSRSNEPRPPRIGIAAIPVSESQKEIKARRALWIGLTIFVGRLTEAVELAIDEYKSEKGS